MKITILSLIFELGNWSWGHTAKTLHDRLGPDFKVRAEAFYEWRKHKKTNGVDVLFSQNVSQMPWIEAFEKTISRLGGNMSFDAARYKDRTVLEGYMEKMGKCFAVIATNNHLYKIAKTVNKNVFLIPNGIDLSVWQPKPARRWNLARPVIGFCGNVVHKSNAEYKGYGILKEACRRVNLDIKEALFRTKQIPHDQMMKRFFHRIDILAHPTAGEGCSNTIMEALACGVPVITTRCAGFHGEMLEGGKNVVFCERTADSIEAAIRLFLKHPELMAEIGAAGREFAEKHHNIDDIAAQYREVFAACAEKNRNDV